MTLGYFAFSLGAMLLYSAVTNTPVRNLILGLPGPGQPSDILARALPGSSGATTSKVGAGGGRSNWKGTPVCAKFIPILKQAERDGADTRLSSGIRTRQQSIAACQRICGANSCEGRCAGENSAHNGCEPGAIDVKNPRSFDRAMRKRGYPLRNALGAADPYHYSEDGH